MATVLLNRELARRFNNEQTRVQLSPETTTVRGVIRELEVRFPGIQSSLRGAVSINGEIYQDCLFEPVPSDAEVCFIPAIEGG